MGTDPRRSRALHVISLVVLSSLFAVLVAEVGYARGAADQQPGPPTGLRIVGVHPAISAVTVSNITATAAAITWTTDKASSSQVEYGITASYGSTSPVDGTLVTSHAVALSGLVSNTLYYFRVHSQDATGNSGTSATFTFTTAAPPDTAPPTVAITAPGGGSTVSGSLAVSASASDNVGVAGVQFKLDGANLGAEDTTAPYSVTWSTTTASNGAHTLTAVARDAAGNIGTSTPIAVTVANDSTLPAVSITAPAGGATVSGSVTVAATASDNVAVVGVRFKLDGVNVGAEDMAAPYSIAWDTTTAANGAHTLTAVARDAAGNSKTSAGVSVTVSNGNVLQLSPLDTSLNLNTTNFSAATTLTTYTWPNQRVANVILMKFDLSTVPANAVVQSATLHLALVETDATADTTYSIAAHKVVGKNPVITTATGYTIDGVTPWTANACCNNNVPMAQADIAAAENTQAIDKTLGFKSWTVTDMVEDWLADPSTNFGVVLNSDASRLADRYRYFASMEHADSGLRPYLRIAYTIAPPDPTPPSVSISAPAAGATVSGTVTVTANASDNVGVASVQFQVDGANLGAKDTSAPFSIAWDTATAAAGAHTLRAIARDAAGNSTTSAGVAVTVVDNGAPTISAVAASAISSAGATITWTTNELSDSQVEYGTTTAYGSTTTLNASLVTAHTAGLSNLAAGTLYHYRVRSKDAAGNLATSGDFTFTTLAAGGGGLLFESNWSTATGTSNSAVTDGGRWPKYWEFNNGTGVQLMSVVAGGPNGQNALRVQQRGSTLAADLQVDNLLPQSTDYYVRYYFKTDDTSSAGDHIATVDHYNYSNLTFMRKYGGATSFRFVISMYGCGGSYPYVHWGPSQPLANGQWYRFEYFVDFVNSNHIQVHPRVYDAAGTLILSDAQFLQEDGAGSLASYYAAGNSFCTQPTWVNDFAVGNNGQASAVDTGKYWYFAGIQLRSDTWPGPLPGGGGGDTTPPSVSISAPASGATVSGSATVSATATDNVGVSGVQFKLDGVNLGVEDTSAPYSVSWNTSGTTNGAHTLTAVARDAAGNQKTSAAVTVTVSNGVPPPAGGIAALFPGDVGIENHADVVFVEKFEEPTLNDMLARWTDIGMSNLMSFNADVPPGSPGLRSLNAAWQGGTQNTTGLYKQLPGVDDTLHVRYYIKYPTTGLYRHDGVWMGGYNPPLSYPFPRAGSKPAGNERFSASAEQLDNHSRFDHYNYWMNMRAGGDGMYWGNNLLNNPSVTVGEGKWVCIEQMVKLNNPVSSFNGEHAIWVDGVKVSHLGQGFPNGRWSGGTFTQDPTGSPFEGFRWRNDANLDLNYIWLQVYAPDDPSGFTGNMKFDHVVVAKSYIGCLAQ